MQFTEAVVNLKFDEDPKYGPYAALFESLCGPAPARPILMEASVARVGQKRPRDSTDEEAQDIVRPYCCEYMGWLFAGLCLNDLLAQQASRRSGNFGCVCYAKLWIFAAKQIIAK